MDRVARCVRTAEMTSPSTRKPTRRATTAVIQLQPSGGVTERRDDLPVAEGPVRTAHA